MGGAYQRVAGDDHVQDWFGQVGVEVSDGGRKHDDVLSEGLIGIGQTPVHVADSVVSLQRSTSSPIRV